MVLHIGPLAPVILRIICPSAAASSVVIMPAGNQVSLSKSEWNRITNLPKTLGRPLVRSSCGSLGCHATQMVEDSESDDWVVGVEGGKGDGSVNGMPMYCGTTK